MNGIDRFVSVAQTTPVVSAELHVNDRRAALNARVPHALFRNRAYLFFAPATLASS